MIHPDSYPFEIDVVRFLRKAAGASRVNKVKPRYNGERMALLAYEMGIGRDTLRKILNQKEDESGNPPFFADRTHQKVYAWLRENQPHLAPMIDTWRQPRFKQSAELRDKLKKKTFRL